jgi:N-acetylglucosaminyl-diphospho-decaprenol L-rhamnosyltransferase
MKDLAVIIVSYNTREFLEPCLEALPAALGDLAAETWVVDNASSDGSVRLVRDHFPGVHLIASPRNGGYAHGNNLGLAAAGFGARVSSTAPRDPSGRFRHALLLNPDTLPPPASLDKLVCFMDANPWIGVCGPRLERPNGRLDRACRRGAPTPLVAFYQLTGIARLFSRSRHFARYNLTYLPVDLQAEVDSVVGACMLIRGEALRTIGLMDERFFMYGEDLDLCLRIKARGWKIVYYPAVRVVHHKGRATRKFSQQMTREFYRSMGLFHRKHFAQSYPRVVNIGVQIAIRLACALALVRNALRPPRRRAVGSA